ncbi:rhodanese-like domain-containing protein [Dongshaea marina]|uniref:rhodanese-like domain-containing protein n=1 Tax=Dongshaea marina TaxID=2047966 RepID=UPI000D3E2D53|nr:rhodanese-like domain-containing protein [Dongshaea marina]
MQHSEGFLSLVNRVRPCVREVDVHWVKARYPEGEFVLLDVREADELRSGKLPGATHLGKGVIERDIEQLFPDKETPLVLYCGGGFRSILAADNLNKMGYQQVISMDGGFRGWKEAGYPIENPS